jgi:hypothetical protein
LISSHANGSALSAGHRMRLEPQLDDDVAHVRNLRIGGVGFHND